jgi:HSP20 family protein
MTRKTGRTGKDEGLAKGLGGILGGLAELVEKLGELSDKGKELSRTGEFTGDAAGKEFKGVYGFNVRVGLGEDKEQVKVEPFGNIRRDKESGRTVVQEIREPMVDVLEEDDYTLVVAEMPGVSRKDVKVSLRDDLMTIIAEKGDKKYRKEILLPQSYTEDKMTVSCNNGILEIKCKN